MLTNIMRYLCRLIIKGISKGIFMPSKKAKRHAPQQKHPRSGVITNATVQRLLTTHQGLPLDARAVAASLVRAPQTRHVARAQRALNSLLRRGSVPAELVA